ncbi:MAG TPA: acetyltransferase [Acetobacteraceae bacterium]|nr:acetyltransferase [Acetobacteraceae bacterium]
MTGATTHSPPPLVLVGAGGHAKVVIEAARAEGRFTVAGLIDPKPSAPEVLGVPVLGGDEALPRLRTEGVGWAFVALGSNAARERIGNSLRAAGFRLASIVHPAAVVMPSARIGEGVVVMARVVVSAEARIDDLAILNTGAVVEHDNQIGAAAHIAPLAALAGNVRIGARALVGVGSAIRPGITVGEDAVVGAGSAVVADVPAGATVGGVPARALSLARRGADRERK